MDSNTNSGTPYRVDVHGFLEQPDDWDEGFVITNARAVGITTDLTADHWRVIRYLRRSAIDEGVLPTLYQTCEDNDIHLDELMRLFPDGYHRGAVKLAGLSFY